MSCIYSKLAIFVVTVVAFCSCGCSKKMAGNGLPDPTQSGKMTFGALVDGKAFKPNSWASGSSANAPICDYAINGKGRYYLNGQAFDLPKGNYLNITGGCVVENKLSQINLFINNEELTEGKTYPLTTPDVSDGASAIYTKNIIVDHGQDYIVKSPLKGELIITKFDSTNNILSGRFWFDAVSDSGDKIQVKEGRFDLRIHYSRNI